jgi:hypothetical protein
MIHSFVTSVTRFMDLFVVWYCEQITIIRKPDLFPASSETGQLSPLEWIGHLVGQMTEISFWWPENTCFHLQVKSLGSNYYFVSLRNSYSHLLSLVQYFGNFRSAEISPVSENMYSVWNITGQSIENRWFWFTFCSSISTSLRLTLQYDCWRKQVLSSLPVSSRLCQYLKHNVLWLEIFHKDRRSGVIPGEIEGNNEIPHSR